MIVDRQEDKSSSPIREFIQKKKRLRDSSAENRNKSKVLSEDSDRNVDDNNCYSDDERNSFTKSNLSLSVGKKASVADKNKLRIIEPYRTLGLVVDYNKVQNFTRNTDRFILASNFHSFLLYNLDKIKLERISPPLSQKITALALYKNKVFTGVGNKILLWEKIHIVQQYTVNDIDDEEFYYKKIITFDNLLIASTSKGDLHIFDIFKGKIVKVLPLNIDNFVHPSTYLNKILFTKRREQYEEDLNISNAKIYLYNINTEKQIFEFDLATSNSSMEIKAIEQSPVIDVVGFGFSSGDIIIFNLKSLKKIMSFKSEYSVETLAFSNCVNMNMSLLASGTPNGDINLWDLNKQSLHYTISKNLTDVSSLVFLPNEQILLATSGKDNAIKMFKMELNTGTPVLLKQRKGHSSHPQRIRFYGEAANNESYHILSQSNSGMRNISILNEHMSREFAVSIKNLPSEIRHELAGSHRHFMNFANFDFNEFRERDWSNVLVNVQGFSHPLLFNYENSTVTDTLTQVKSKSSCTAVCVSMCGNFGFAGFEDGSIEKFNMQSGMSKFVIEKAHDNAVVGIKTDGINSMIISISLDGSIKFWDFFQSALIKKIQLGNTPKLLDMNRDNDLIAVALIDSSIQIYDKGTFKLVRQFINKGSNHNCNVNDVIFSKDGKWLISVSDDKSLKIYDVLSGNLIEWVSFKYIPVSVAISPNNQYIAISFVELNGIYLWINRSLFVDLVDIEEITSPIKFEMPFSKDNFRTRKTRREIDEEEKEALQEVKRSVMDNKENSVKSKLNNYSHAQNESLIQLSSESRLKFRILNHLEKIQEKNLPKIKRKEKAKAPFFLFNINNPEDNLNPNTSKESPSSELMNILKNYTHFKNEKMINGKSNSESKELILTDLLDLFSIGKVKSSQISAFLNSINPYLIDLEIRNLDPLLMMSEEKNYLSSFLDYIQAEITAKRNFELVQAYLNRFLKIFTEYSIKDKLVKSQLEKINVEIEKSYSDMEFLFNNTMCLVSHFGKIQI